MSRCSLAVLRTAGKSKRDNLDAEEMLLLMRTLRDMNLSKFVAADSPLFLSLIKDLFPGLERSQRGLLRTLLATNGDSSWSLCNSSSLLVPHGSCCWRWLVVTSCGS